ncbi:MAG: hypothetical protein ACRC5M_05540 [Anaeroplasmataceae bacterium]
MQSLLETKVEIDAEINKEEIIEHAYQKGFRGIIRINAMLKKVIL